MTVWQLNRQWQLDFDIALNERLTYSFTFSQSKGLLFRGWWLFLHWHFSSQMGVASMASPQCRHLQSRTVPPRDSTPSELGLPHLFDHISFFLVHVWSLITLRAGMYVAFFWSIQQYPFLLFPGLFPPSISQRRLFFTSRSTTLSKKVWSGRYNTYINFRMTIMVTIVTCALLASAFVNPAFVSSSSQHLSNDHYAGWSFCQW